MTNTDVQFAERFPDMNLNAFVTNNVSLKDWVPSENVVNTGMLSDIGRATIYNGEIQDSFYSRFMRAPLSRGDSVMSGRFSEIKSRAYDPLAPDTKLFDSPRPSMISNVATKNFSRQIAVEVNNYWIRQFAQTQEMIGDAMAAIMAESNICYRDDMWVAGKTYFSGSMRRAKADSIYIMDNGIEDVGFADEMIEELWRTQEREFAYKSTKYNASGYNTLSKGVHIALKKDVEYPAFKKFYAETFNPGYLKVASTIDYVDDFATPAGAPADAGELLGMIVDSRAFAITPMPDTLTTESFRNPVRKSTAFFTTYEYAFQHDPFFNIKYIFAKKESSAEA